MSNLYSFLLDVRCSKWPCSFFWSCLSPMIILLWSTPMVSFVNFKMSLETTRYGIVIHKYIKHNSTLHLCTLIWSELNYIAICLCNKESDFTFLLNKLVVYSLPSAMSSISGNHTMDLLYLLKDNLKIS